MPIVVLLIFFVGKQNNYVGPVLDFTVDDLEKTKKYLLENGCEILEWTEDSKFLRDPFGMCFNLYPKS